jgi:hypothetical protein
VISASVVIPTFNRASLLPRAIESALTQTHPCEVVVCDHGSTDATPDVAARYGNRIRYIRREVDNGPIVCWRDGVAQATGELLHLNFDDDWTEPEFMARCAALFRDDVGFVYTRYAVHNAASHRIWFSGPHPSGVRRMPHIVRYLLRTQLTISPGCAVFRRSDALVNLLPEVPGAEGLYGKNKGVGEDVLLFLLTSLRYPYYAHVPQPLANFLAHPGSITIDAVGSSKYVELVKAYSKAKAYYHSLPGSEAPRSGLADAADRLAWNLVPGNIPRVARKAGRLCMRALGKGDW